MPLSNNTAGSSSSIGSVLGSVAAVAAGSEVLPRTGMGSWLFYLVLATMAAAAAVIVSFAVTRIARFFLKVK